MRKQKKRGFTLIELIVVVAILVALLLILVPRLTGFTSTAAEVQCQQTRQKVMEMYNAYQIKGEPVSIEDLLKNKDDEYFISTPKCASGGKYSVVEIKGLVTLIKCSKHGSITSGNLDTTPIGIQNTVMGITEYFSHLSESERYELMNWKFMDNTHIFNFMRDEIYGGKWPPLDENISKAAGLKGSYSIQICYDKDAYNKLDSSNSIIFASTYQTVNWSTRLIYNPENHKWYSGEHNISVANYTWEEVKKLMEVNDWKPVEYSE
ncbi:prepilin-type N-terminal cleavage/methylation domain-containing protein [Holdemania filiformis]|uniref:prepilin-type N-terminal cleavage/methylation domain-containing protein n=1 Tax=Holdemania filiformis TaxID=61171 RepID=UPI00267695DB|nr:prepilin-type N-terminal cleavage/methylation domain-containing protein [Holdemania filiformis]